MAYKNLQEFSPEIHKGLQSVMKAPPTHEIVDQHWVYFQIFSGGELVDTHWVYIANNPNIVIDDGLPFIDFYNLLVDDFKYTEGTYTIQYCFKRKAAWPNEWLRVNSISKNKMEARFDAIHEEAMINMRYPLIGALDYVPLNFYNEEVGFIKAVNWTYDEYYEKEDETLIVKFADPLPRKVKVGTKLEVWDDLTVKQEITLRLVIEQPSKLEPYTQLYGPKFTLDLSSQQGRPTEFSSWDNILDATTETKLKTINKIFSGSGGAEVNVDYRKFENFIHFSSAKERLTNFQYKLSLIEFYESKSSAYSTGLVGQESSSVTSSQAYMTLSADYNLQKQKVIGSFDGFEEYMYYESSSGHTDTFGTWYPTTWPKSNSSKPYTNVGVTSAAGINWISGSLHSASVYDVNNMSYLRKAIPEHIQIHSSNDGFMLFIDMIGQHFDILYNYVDNLTTQKVRDERFDVGVSKDLLYETIRSFGLQPTSGYDLESIWSYWLGTDNSGSYQTTSSIEHPTAANLNYVVTESMSKKDLEAEPWSRILNNLPYLLKTRGTRRGLKALLSCYGIPNSIFKIQEMGGPDPKRNISGSHLREIDIINHSLQFQGGAFGGSKTSYVSGAWDVDANTVEMRFKSTARDCEHSMSLWDVRRANTSTMHSKCWIEPSASSKYGWVHFNYRSTDYTTWHTASLALMPILDNDWWNLMVQKQDTGNKILMRVQKAPDHAMGKITHETSSTHTAPDGNFYGWENALGVELNIGKGSTINHANSISRPGNFSGSIQEFRLWDNELDTFAFTLHTKAPTSNVGNSYTSSYDNILVRLPFGTDNNIPPTASYYVTSSHPNPTTNKYYELVGDLQWEEEEEVYYITTMNSLGMRPLANKVRVEDNTIPGTLDPFKSHEASSHDTNPIDLPDLYVSISPQDDLDIDIGLQYGQVQIDDFIGDPRERWSWNYQKLKSFRDNYFKKFNGPQQIQAFIRLIKYFNMGLFKQIESMLPARGTNVVGLMIKPTMLERPKISAEPSFSFQEIQYLGIPGQAQQNLEHYTQSIDCMPDRYLEDSDDYDAMQYVFTHDGTYARQWFSTLTDTVRTPAWDPNIYSHSTVTINYQTGVFNDTHFLQDGFQQNASGSRTWNSHQEIQFHYNNTVSLSRDDWHSSSLIPATSQPKFSAGEISKLYMGSKLWGQDFNIPSLMTIDHGPVVQFIEGNPNSLFSVEPTFLGDLDVR